MRTKYRKVTVDHGQRPEHIIIAERALGRALPSGVEVHHFDENGLNNANSNLVICENRAYHAVLHARQRVVAACGDPNIHRICMKCGIKPKSEFYRSRTRYEGLHQECKSCVGDGQRQRVRGRTLKRYRRAPDYGKCRHCGSDFRKGRSDQAFCNLKCKSTFANGKTKSKREAQYGIRILET